MSFFIDTRAVESLCVKYGFTQQHGVVFNTAGRPIIFNNDVYADDHSMYTGHNCYGISGKVEYGGKTWLKIGDYIYDNHEMYRQLLHETYGFGRFTDSQLKDIEDIFVLVSDGCWFCESLTFPLYWDSDAEITVSRPVRDIFEQFVRFETSKLPFGVTEVWDDDTIETRSEEFVEMRDVGPEYQFDPVPYWVEEDIPELTMEEIQFLMDVIDGTDD